MNAALETEFRYCNGCGRILHPRKDGTMPHHRVPTPTNKYHPHGRPASTPLTGPNAPWCIGGGKP